MKFSMISNNNIEQSVDCIVFGVYKSGIISCLLNIINHKTYEYILEIIKYGDFQGKIGQTLLLYDVPYMEKKRVLLVGCGIENQMSILDYKKIILTCIKKLININSKQIQLFLIDLNVLNLNMYWKVRLLIEKTYEAIHINKFKKFKYFCESKNNQKNIILNVENIKNFKTMKLGMSHANAALKGIIRTKNLCNMPPNICNAKYLAKKSQNLQLEYPRLIKTTIINKQDMEILKMGAYLSVSNGSLNPPFMSIIKYQGNINNKKGPIILIGKGVTFDSGGLSIKPSKNLDEMKYDMSGAASVYGVMTTISELQLPINVIGIIAGCDNMVGSNSYRPGDIITTMSGKKVEIINTDAEGRLILCDVLTYITRFNPSIVIDIATLTGACVVALGKTYSGLMSNHEKLAEDLIYAGNVSDDLVWRLPLHQDYIDDLQSPFANLNNSDKGLAGASVAACFLLEFIKEYSWAHLDIAGTAWSSSPSTGSTGRPNKLLFEYLLKKSQILR